MTTLLISPSQILNGKNLKMLKTLLHFSLQFFLSILILLYTLTLLPLTVLLLLPIKVCVSLLAKLLRKDLAHMLSGQSSILAEEDISNKPGLNICVYQIYDNYVDVESLKNLFEERVIQKTKPNGEIMYPELKQFWSAFFNYKFWKQDESFDLGNHVRSYDYLEESLKLGGIKETLVTESDLRRVMGPLLESPWVENRSPWELLVVNNFEIESGKSGTVLIFRIHHALGDGYSILKLILRDLLLVKPKRKINFLKIGGWRESAFKMVLPLKMCWDVAGSILNSFDGANCWHRFGLDRGHLSRSVYTSLSKPIDTQIIKEVKNEFGVSYQAVLCAVAASSCQRVMGDAGQVSPSEITCMVPIPLPGHPDGLVNFATLDFLKWSMGKRLTRQERLYKISEFMTPSKFYTAPLAFSFLGNVLLPLLPNCLLKIRDLANYTVFMTSFPGPEEAPTLKGPGINATLVDAFASVGPGAATIGTTMCLLSFNGKQRFTVNIDKNLFPSQKLFENFGIYVEQELKILLETRMKTRARAESFSKSKHA